MLDFALSEKQLPGFIVWIFCCFISIIILVIINYYIAMNVINSIKNKQIFFSTWLKRVYLIIHYHIVVSLSLDNDLIPYVRTYTCSISCSFVLRCVGEIRLKIPNFEITKKTSKLLLSSNKENFTRASE